MFRVLAILGVTVLASCSGDGVASLDPARSTLTDNPGGLDTPNSLPNGFTTRNPMAPDTGVVGVTHLAP